DWCAWRDRQAQSSAKRQATRPLQTDRPRRRSVLEYALPKSVAQLRRFFRGSDCTGADPSQFSRKAPPGSSRDKPSIISPRFEEHIGGNPRMGCGLSRIAGVEPIEVIPGASVERLQKR